MTKKQGYIIGAIFLAVVALIAGFCFVFLGNKDIEDVPGALKVEKIDDEFILVTEYNNEYEYEFKLEQYIDGQYVVVGVVNSKTNAINLLDCNMNIVAGERYRFSACFTVEEGVVKGEYSQEYDWQPSWVLNSVDYSSVVLDDESQTLSWRAVHLADSYAIRLIDMQGNVVEKFATQNAISLNEIEVGQYKLYIVAKNSQNEYLWQSNAGAGKDLLISRQNEILHALRGQNNALTVTSTQRVEEFEIYVNESLKGILLVENFIYDGFNYVYNFENASILLANLDFETEIVEIKSLKTVCVGESEFVQIF